MATKTKTQLADRVLRKGGIIDALATGAAHDLTYIGDVYDDKLEEWRDRELVYWPNDEIPSAIFETIVDLVWNQVEDTYRRTGRLPLEVRAEEEEILRSLRRHTEVKASGLVVHVDYF